MTRTVKVLRTYCPFWERTVYELWDGLRPIIPANNYLRADLALGDNTLADKAYSLALFFRFLQRNSISFLDLTEQSLKALIVLFRNELLFRVRRSDDRAERSYEGDCIRKLSYARAGSVLSEVGWLCEWWGLVKNRLSREISHSWPRWAFGRRSIQRLPECFRIGIPTARKRFCENHVLEATEVEAIWRYLTFDARPVKPKTLVSHPFGPRRGWAPARSEAWRRAQQRHRERLAWFHRQQMLWALMIGSGMRRSEIPLLMLRDVQFRGEDLWISIRPRRATEALGKAKSGSRTIFIGWDSRVITAWQNWTRSRLVLIDRWVREAGRPAHEMFLTNRNGGPLTVEGLSSLFESLNARFRVFGGDFEEDQFTLHPHAIRHTVKTLFEVWGAPRDVIQRHLGHRSPQTTDLYGKVYRKTYVDSLALLDSRLTTDPVEGMLQE